jgi:transcriptional regulator with XRE-family HTH domain
MDIQKITSDLIATGLTQQELADLVPCSQPTISALLKGSRGARPSLKIGIRLIDLHKERVLEGKEPHAGRRKDDQPGCQGAEPTVEKTHD